MGKTKWRSLTALCCRCMQRSFLFFLVGVLKGQKKKRFILTKQNKCLRSERKTAGEGGGACRRRRNRELTSWSFMAFSCSSFLAQYLASSSGISAAQTAKLPKVSAHRHHSNTCLCSEFFKWKMSNLVAVQSVCREAAGERSGLWFRRSHSQPLWRWSPASATGLAPPGRNDRVKVLRLKRKQS